MKKLGLLASAAPAVLGAGLIGAIAAMPVTALAATAAPAAYTGPFAAPSTLPFHAPDFAHIKDTDYRPAIEAGIAAKRAEIARITMVRSAPTFENTVVALERAGQLLDRVTAVFDQMVSANTNPVLDATDTATAPQLAALRDEIHLNAPLFARIKAVHDSAAGKALTGEDAMLLRTTYDEFVHAGALLNPAQKAELKAMNQRLAALQTEFSQKLTQGTDAAAVVFDSKDQLAGLSEAEIAGAAQRAKDKGMPGKYVLALLNTTQQPALAKLSNRDSRRKLFEASINRDSQGGPDDTTAIVSELATLRARKAALLGKPNYATFAMYDGMVTSPEKAMSFMKGFVAPLRATQDSEAEASGSAGQS